jgi:hypothetical protein
VKARRWADGQFARGMTRLASASKLEKTALTLCLQFRPHPCHCGDGTSPRGIDAQQDDLPPFAVGLIMNLATGEPSLPDRRAHAGGNGWA